MTTTLAPGRFGWMPCLVLIVSWLGVVSSAAGAEHSPHTELFEHPVVRRIVSMLFVSTPAFLLLQLVALVVLLWRVARWRADALAARWFERWLLVLGVVVAPMVMLVVSAGFAGTYQAERGHWFFHVNEGLAGLAFVPVYLAGSCLVGWGIARRDYGLRSGTQLIVLWSLLAVCVWYAFATTVLNMASDTMLDTRALGAVPALAAVNYALLATDVMRHDRLSSAPAKVVFVWLSALALSLAVKVPLAMRIFDALPPEAPPGTGDCFVVGAATRGHPGFVGSSFDSRLGRTVNWQWRSLRAFEDLLARRRPGLHLCVRRIYDRIGPPVAARIRTPLTADLAYVALKPLEWTARACLSVERLLELSKSKNTGAANHEPGSGPTSRSG